MNRVAIVGATGYAGAELVRILAGHPATELTVLTSRQYAGVRFDHIRSEIKRHKAEGGGVVCRLDINNLLN